MEDIIENLNYNKVNIYEIWHTDTEKRFKSIASSYNFSKIHQKSSQIINSIIKFIYNVNKSLNSNNFVILEDRLEFEHGCFQIFNVIVKELDLNKNLDALQLNSFIDLFMILSKNSVKSIFQIKTISFILKLCGESKTLMKYLQNEQIQVIFNSLKIDLIKDEYYFDFSSKEYEKEVITFFENLTDSFIKNNISLIQIFYEYFFTFYVLNIFKKMTIFYLNFRFTVIKSTRISDCLYSNISKLILKRCHSIEKIPCKTIYYDLIENEDKNAKMLKILNREEKILRTFDFINKFILTDLNIQTAEDYLFELVKIITHKNSEKNTWVLENYSKEICDQIFKIFANSVSLHKIDLLELFSNFAIQLKQNLKNCKSVKKREFIEEIIINLTNICDTMLDKSDISDVLLHKMAIVKKSIVKCFLKILRCFCSLIIQMPNENVHKETSRLILKLFNLLVVSNQIDLVEFIERLIIKNVFFDKSNNIHDETEWIIIINQFFIYLYKLNLSDDKNNIQVNNLILKRLVDAIVDKVKMNYKMINYIQSALFEYIICKPIEVDIDSKNFYDIIQLFYPLVSFGFLSRKSKQLKPIFRLSLTEKKRSLFDPKGLKFYQQPASLYLKFYTMMAVLLKNQANFTDFFRDDLENLIKIFEDENLFEEIQKDNVKKIVQINEEIEYNTPTLSCNIYYFMLVSFSLSIFGQKGFNNVTVHRLIKLWFKAYKKNLNDRNVKTTLDTCLDLLTINHPTILNQSIETLWEFYLFQNQFQYSKNISKIFHLSNAFKKYDSVFYQKFSNYDAEFINSTCNSILLCSIAENSPDFFLMMVNDTEIRIILMIQLGLDKKDKLLLKCVLKAFEKTIDVIEKIKKTSTTNKKKVIGYAEYLFEYRNKIKSLLNDFDNNDDDEFNEIKLFLLKFYLFLLVNIKRDKEKIDIILKDLIQIDEKKQSLTLTHHLYKKLLDKANEMEKNSKDFQQYDSDDENDSTF